MRKTTFTHVHAAALDGLCAAVRGDQCLVHALELLTARKSNADGYSHQQMAANFYCVERHPEARDVQEAEEEAAQVHGSCPLLLCGAALGRFPLARLESNGAFKAPWVGLKLAASLQFNENLACGRDAARSLPVADGALVATNSVRSLLLCATEISNKFCVGHGGIMALAIWHLP